jgi:hypothetical protein
MAHLLVKYEDNWADEIDLKGFKLFTDDRWQEFQDAVPDKRFTRYVGSNQDIEYDGKKDFLSRFSVQEIEESDYQVLKKFFPHGEGEFPDLDFDDDNEDDDV